MYYLACVSCQNVILVAATLRLRSYPYTEFIAFFFTQQMFIKLNFIYQNEEVQLDWCHGLMITINQQALKYIHIYLYNYGWYYIKEASRFFFKAKLRWPVICWILYCFCCFSCYYSTMWIWWHWYNIIVSGEGYLWLFGLSQCVIGT